MSKIIGYVMLAIVFGLILGVVIHIAGLIPALFIVGGALFMTLWVVIAIGLTSGGLRKDDGRKFFSWQKVGNGIKV